MRFPCNTPIQAVSEEVLRSILTDRGEMIETSIASLEIGFRCGIQGIPFRELEIDEKLIGNHRICEPSIDTLLKTKLT